MSRKKNSKVNEFIWRIEGILFNAFLKAKNQKKFTSKSFKLCGATWSLNCYPNGHEKDDQGFVGVFLECLSLPIYSQSVEVNYHLSFVELAHVKHLAKSFESNVSWGYAQAFPHKQLKKLRSKRLTIKCIIQRTMNIENLITHNALYWAIDGKLLQRFKSAVNEECYESPTFTTHDGSVWYFACYPNGIDEIDEGYCSLYLHNQSLSKVRRYGMGINYQIRIIELNKSYQYAKTFHAVTGDNSWGNAQMFQKKRLYKLSKLTIKCVFQETMTIHHGRGDKVTWKIEENLLDAFKGAKCDDEFTSPTFQICDKVTWKIEENLLDAFKGAKCDDEFTSPTFQICDTIWNLSCYPKGLEGHPNYFSLYLECNGFTVDFMQNIHVNYRFDCVECKDDNAEDGLWTDSMRWFEKQDSYG
eukprot:1134914_1